MNFNRNSSTTQSASKSALGNLSTQASSAVNTRIDRNDQQHFQKLLNDLKHSEPQTDSPSDEVEPSLLTETSAFEGFEGVDSALPIDANDQGELDEDSSSFIDDHEMPFVQNTSEADETQDGAAEHNHTEHEGTESQTLSMSAPAFAASQEHQGANTHAEQSALIGSLPLNEAAAKIIEQMQAQIRKRETRRWQFSLPGLLGASVEVTIECSEDHSWIVELSMTDDYSDEEHLALQHRLTEQMNDVSVVLVRA